MAMQGSVIPNLMALYGQSFKAEVYILGFFFGLLKDTNPQNLATHLLYQGRVIADIVFVFLHTLIHTETCFIVINEMFFIIWKKLKTEVSGTSHIYYFSNFKGPKQIDSTIHN